MLLEELLTPAEAAQILRVTAATVVRWLNEKQIKGFKLGEGKKAEWRIHKQDLEAYIESRRG